MTLRNRRRLQLILVAAIFVAPFLAALLLYRAGWQPGTKSSGQPILPQRSFTGIDVALADGGHWAWRDSEPRMTLVALPGPDCATSCVDTLALMRNARITLNRNMGRLRLLYVGTPPAGAAAGAVARDWQVGRDVADALASFRPSRPDSVAALLVESNGTALLHYPAGFDPSGLRKDLQKVIR
jgi:hypothetical protein